MTKTAPPPRTATDGPLIAVVLIGVGLVLLVWLTGQVASWLFGGAWPAVAPSEAVGIALRLPAEPLDPAAAWPRRTGVLLPGPVRFYTVMLGLVVVAVAGVGGVVAGWQRLTSNGSRGDEPKPAAWAGPKDLRALTVRGPTPGRLTLGRHGRHLLATEQRHSLIVLGPTQTGKTTGLAVPAVLEWDGPVVATSVKTDLLADTYAWRRSHGPVWVYDPTRSTGAEYPPARWTPLEGCATWAGALRTATWLAEAGRDGAGFGDGDFWYANAAKLLAPLLLAAAVSERTMADVVRWIDTQEQAEVALELEAAGVAEALQAAAASWGREDRQRSSVYTTAETVLRAFADPAVAGVTVAGDLAVDRFLDGRSSTLYVCAPSHEQDRLRPLFSSLLHQVISVATERVAATGRPLDPPLLLVLDEAANIAPLRDLDRTASTAAGLGIQLVTVWQDLAQLQVRYGQRASTVVNNHRAKLVLSGISDQATLEYLSRLLGDTELTRRTNTVGQDGRRSSSEAKHYRQLASSDTLRQLAPGEAVLVSGHHPPARLRLRPWYHDRELSRRARNGGR